MYYTLHKQPCTVNFIPTTSQELEFNEFYFLYNADET